MADDNNDNDNNNNNNKSACKKAALRRSGAALKVKTGFGRSWNILNNDLNVEVKK